MHACVCMFVVEVASEWKRGKEREGEMREWLFNINMLEPSEMFPLITVFTLYPAVIPTACVCVCVCARMLLELRMREIKSIRRLYNLLKLSAFCLCVRLIVQFSILSFYVHHPITPLPPTTPPTTPLLHKHMIKSLCGSSSAGSLSSS